jgi:hypothetical protein
MKRGGPIARRTRLESKTRVKPVNKKRAAWKHERNFKNADYVRTLPCVVCGRWGTEDYPNQSAHIKARGMGGCNGDYRDQFPACDTCHKEYDAGPKTWAKKHPEINLRAIADAIVAAREKGEEIDVQSVYVHWQLGQRSGDEIHA